MKPKVHYYKCYYNKTGKVVVIETTNTNFNFKQYDLTFICETSKASAKKMTKIRMD